MTLDSNIASHEQRVRVDGDWTILIEPDFEFIDNGDSWQAYKGGRVVYVSSISVTDEHGHKVPAEALLAGTADSLGPGKRIRFLESDVCGEAEIKPSETGSQLMGFMCAHGTVATCVIDFEEEQDIHWATSTWRSLRFELAGDKTPKPWWRFW
jgi:hypothetical protein